jgi:hypothetical protein
MAAVVTLERRTPLKRTALKPGKPLKRSGELRRVSVLKGRKRLPAESAKRKDERPQRDEVRRIVLQRDQACVMFLLGFTGCWGPPEVHEPEFRSRFPGEKPWLDPDRAVRTCQGHNRWIQENDASATSLGLSVHQGDPRWSAERWRAQHLGMSQNG